MNDEILNNIWDSLTTDQLISSDLETWKANIKAIKDKYPKP